MEKKMLNLAIKAKLKYTLFFGSFLLIAPITLSEAKAQSPGIVITTADRVREDLMRPMNIMMDKILTVKMTGDFEKDYVSIMQEFQQGGIDLCKIYQMTGEDPKLLENAKVSVVELKEQQKRLKSFAALDNITGSGKVQNNLMETLNIMIAEMKRKAQSGDINSDYAAMKVLYNWAATEMGEAQLQYGLNSELKNETRDMIEGFSCKESNLMDWLDKNGMVIK